MIFKPKHRGKSERRRYKRVNVLMPMCFTVICKGLKDDHVNLNFLGICRNMSGGGLLLEVSELKEEMLLCNNLLKLELKLTKEEKPIYAFARLIKAGRSPTQDSYYLGLCFVHIEDHDREKISNFVNARLSKRKH